MWTIGRPVLSNVIYISESYFNGITNNEVTSRQKNCRGDPRSFPFRLFTKLLKCSKLLFSVADNKLMIFLELGFFALLLHVEICELSHAYYMPIIFSILQVNFLIIAVDVLDLWMIVFRHQFLFSTIAIISLYQSLFGP